MGVKIELLREKLKGIHAHDTASVAVWECLPCPLCDAVNGFVGGCNATMDFLKTGVFQCRADFRHAGWLENGYVHVVDLKFHESEILIKATPIELDKFMEIEDWKAGKNSEGIVFKPSNPYSPDDGGSFIKITSDWHFQPKYDGLGKGMGKAMLGIDETVMTEELYKKVYGHPSTNPCLEVPLPSVVGGEAIKHQVTMKVVVKPKAYPMPLLNPKSAWGKRMAEKLAQKS